MTAAMCCATDARLRASRSPSPLPCKFAALGAGSLHDMARSAPSCRGQRTRYGDLGHERDVMPESGNYLTTVCDPPMSLSASTRRSFRGGPKRPLTQVRYFYMLRNMKTIPVAKLQATDRHVEAFKALAHPTRLQVFFFLVRREAEVPVGEIQAELEIPGPTLSHHLDLLRRADLVQSRREGTFIYYSPKPDMVTELVRLLTACC
jgi:ArsR family transcriptional regulator